MLYNYSCAPWQEKSNEPSFVEISHGRVIWWQHTLSDCKLFTGLNLPGNKKIGDTHFRSEVHTCDSVTCCTSLRFEQAPGYPNRPVQSRAIHIWVKLVMYIWASLCLIAYACQKNAHCLILMYPDFTKSPHIELERAAFRK